MLYLLSILIVQLQEGKNFLEMLPEERRRKIIEEIRNHGAVKTSDLSSLFSVSEITVRNDLDKLAEQQLLIRTHGGAVTREGTAFEPSHQQKELFNIEEKKKIGKVAASLITDNTTVYLSTGTTTMQMIPHLRTKKHLTVLTNSLYNAMELSKIPEITVSIIGGNLRRVSFAMVGPDAERYFENIYVDQLFLGVNGISIEKGLTTPTVVEAQVCRLMMKASRETIVLADHSKFNNVVHAKIADIDKLNSVITDNMLDEKIIGQMEDLGIKVIVAT